MQLARDDGVVMALFFSGGGLRASALSYGVMCELARTPLADGRRLLDDVDLINAVSGGSFTAAYYCLYGDRLFTDYENDFLKREIEGILLRRTLIPLYNVRLWPADYARSDLAADLYDKLLFHGATFADLKRGEAARRPFLIIDSTNVTTGDSFAFVQQQFDLIGSDLSDYRISRAVAASSAVPVLLTPIILKNYGRSGPAGAASAGPAANDSVALSVLQKLITAREQRLHDPAENPYLFLMDGGLSDNLGLTNILSAVAKSGGWDELIKPFVKRGTHRLVILLVNSASKVPAEWSQKAVTPASGAVMRTLVNTSMNRRNEDITSMLRAGLEAWHKAKGDARSPVAVDFIEIDFSAIKDPIERLYCQHIPTRLSLSAEQVDKLVAVGGELLRKNPDFQKLLLELRGDSASRRDRR